MPRELSNAVMAQTPTVPRADRWPPSEPSGSGREGPGAGIDAELDLELRAVGNVIQRTQLIIRLDEAKDFTATYGILHDLPHRPIVRRSQNPDDLV